MKVGNDRSWSPLIVALALLVSGCTTPQQLENVSSRPDFRDYIGATYELLVPVHLSGVNAPPGYEKTVDYYVINPASPSWSGPELITRETLAHGLEIVVESVHRCTNCPFDDIVKAEVRIIGHQTEFTRPIHIQLKFLGPEFARRL